MLQITTHRKLTTATYLKVSIIAKEICNIDWVTTADSFIDKYIIEVKKIKNKNYSFAEYNYKAFKINDYEVEVWYCTSAGDKKNLLFKITKQQSCQH